MRRIFYVALICTLLSTTVGCFIPIYSADRARRTRQLIFSSEDMRAALNQWERFWFLDQPDHMNPERVHGGVI